MKSELLWQIVVAGSILAVSTVLGSWLGALASSALDRAAVDPMVRRMLVRLVRPLVVFVGAIAAVQYLQVDLTPVTAMLGAATLAVGLALQSSLSNVATGALLLTLRPFRAGDVVEVAGKLGVVVDQTLFHVLIDSPDGRQVTLPNNAVFAQPIENFSRRGARRIELTLTLPFDTDVPGALQALTEACAVDGILAEPAASAVVTSLSPRGPVVAIRAWCEPSAFGTCTSRLAQAVLARLQSDRISVASPPTMA